MPCGLYGKLPAKRDFIALGVPGTVLRAYEPWLQAGLAASRLGLGEGWTDAYLRAPIWRFWLGPDIAGAATLGAVMPCVDGIGRYFPLTLLGQGVEELATPEEDPYDSWFGLAEDLLLSALSETAPFEAVTAALARFPDPVGSRLPPPATGVIVSCGGALVGEAESAGFADTLGRLRRIGGAGAQSGMSYWWTAGGEGFAARAVACRKWPEPELFSRFLTGRFDERAA